MIMSKRLLFCMFLSIIGFNSLKAQDPHFTQFYASPLYLNPAFAGTERCPRFVMNYRNQWPAITGQFVTYSMSYDQHIDAIQGGLGLLVMNDRAGEATLNTTNVSLIYSYLLNVNRNFSLKFGAEATLAQKHIDKSKLTFGDMIDERYGFVYDTQEQLPTDTKTFTDFSAGVLGYSKSFYAGFAAHHLTQPDQGFIGNSTLPMKFTGHAGAVIPIEKNGESGLSISPNILFYKQQDFYQFNLGLYVSRGALVGGVWYGFGDALNVLIGLQQNSYRLGFSYDITTSKLTNATAGSIEFSGAYIFPCKPKKKKFRAVKCPSF